MLGAEARHARLLVLGSREESRIEGLLAGSVAAALTAHAACPAVIMRGRQLSAVGLPVVSASTAPR